MFDDLILYSQTLKIKKIFKDIFNFVLNILIRILYPEIGITVENS